MATNSFDMRVTKRNGEFEEIAFDKILNRIKKLGQEANIQINYSQLTMKVIDQLYDTISTTKIDELAAEQCASMSTMNPDYGTLAGRIVISNHQKNTHPSFSETMKMLYNFTDVHNQHSPLVADKLIEVINIYNIDELIDYDRDYLIDYFGFKTLERAYLFKINGKVVERPQHMWMRVAIGIHMHTNDNSIQKLYQIKETYNLMSQKYFTHATPTLFNAGTPRPQLSSCYLLAMEEDSISGIYNTLKDCALISKFAGGIGLHIHNIRAKGSHIQGTNGTSNGIVPMLRVFNNTARYVDQCVHPDTLISTKNGLIPIKYVVEDSTEVYSYPINDEINFSKEIFNRMNELEENDYSYISYDPKITCTFQKIKKIITHNFSGLIYNIEMGPFFKYDDTPIITRSVKITDKHPILCKVDNKLKWVEAENITIGQKLFGDYIVTSIKTEEYNGLLYDLEMKEYPNYMSNGALLHNGGGKRNGSFAIYLEPWHADIFDFLDLKKNHGDEELKARDLFYSLWIPDLFMERVKQPDGKWSLMCPHECPGLSDVYGEEFVKLYEKYEAEGKARKTIVARDLWFAILDSQMETGTPYLCYKDAANKKSNQQNLGTIKSSNLCSEINLFSDDKETAVCNLASIALPAFVNQETKQFDYDKLIEVTKVVTNNLNKVIDINFYPTEKTRRSNLRHRPIGIGVQGLADAFIMMDIPFHSETAKEVNKLIFETIYYAALEKSNEMAKDLSIQLQNIIEDKCNPKREAEEFLTNEYDLQYFETQRNYNLLGSYTTFEGSPASQGILQFDMWSKSPSNRYDWAKLKENIIKYGLRNSTLLAPMPTASTSQILGYNECFEPLTSNIYSRRTLAGEFVVVNKYLMRDLINLGLWNEKIKNNIVANKGSVQQLTILPQQLKDKYKIVWEIPMKHIIDMAVDRGAFICQSQSLNLWMEDPVYNKLTSMHFYAWEKGLKTGIYYLRRKAKHQAQQFTIEPEKKQINNNVEEEICESCSA